MKTACLRVFKDAAHFWPAKIMGPSVRSGTVSTSFSGLTPTRRLKVGLSLIALITGTLLSQPALCDTVQPDSSPATANDSLDDVRVRLDESEASFQYAAAAAKAGNYRAAIAALERVLQIDPTLDNVKLELGILYLRVQRPDLAIPYLRSAVAAPAIPDAVRARAQEALRTAQGAASAHHFAGTLFAGLQVESNPNAAPSDGVFAPGFGGGAIFLPADLLSVKAKDEGAAVVSFNGEYAYRLPGQGGHEIVVDGALSSVGYKESDSINSAFATLRFGPRFYFGRSSDAAIVVRPYVLGTALNVGSDTYFYSSGGGVDAQWRPTLRLSLLASAQYEARVYKDSLLRPNNSDQSGDYSSGSIGVSWRALQGTYLRADAFGERAKAAAAYQAHDRTGGRISLSQTLPQIAHRAAQLRLTVTAQTTKYDAADPFIGSPILRKDDRLDAEIGVSIPLTRSLLLDLRASQARNKSSLPNFKYDSTTGAAGLVYRF